MIKLNNKLLFCFFVFISACSNNNFVKKTNKDRFLNKLEEINIKTENKSENYNKYSKTLTKYLIENKILNENKENYKNELFKELKDNENLCKKILPYIHYNYKEKIEKLIMWIDNNIFLLKIENKINSKKEVLTHGYIKKIENEIFNNNKSIPLEIKNLIFSYFPDNYNIKNISYVINNLFEHRRFMIQDKKRIITKIKRLFDKKLISKVYIGFFDINKISLIILEIEINSIYKIGNETFKCFYKYKNQNIYPNNNKYKKECFYYQDIKRIRFV